MGSGVNIISKTISPISWISAPLGMFPVSFDGQKFTCSRSRALYCKVVTVVIAIVELWHLEDILFRRTRKAMTGVHVLTSVSYIVGNAVIVLNIFYVFEGRQRLLRFLNEMDLATNFLQRSIRKNWLRLEVFLFVFIMQVITTMTYTYLKLEEFNFHTSISSKALIRWAYVGIRLCGKTTLMCTGIHFCVLCMILTALVRATNEEIQVWCADCQQGSRKFNVQLADRLAKLRIFHSKLYFLSEEISTLYGVFVVLNLVYVNIFYQASSFHMVTTAYKLVHHGKVNWSPDHSYSLYWIFVDAIKALAFFYAAINLVEQNKKTGPILTKCINQMHPGMYREMLSCMCTETSTMKMNMTAGGFFCLDKEMLLSSVYACTLNLSILMQSFIGDLQSQSEDR